MTPAISVVIPTHRDPEGAYLTVAAAYSQLEASGQDFEIIVVNDGSGPLAISDRWPRVQKTDGTFGSPQLARHRGIVAAKGPLVFCLDSHVITGHDFFNRMTAEFYSHEVAAVFCPLVTTNRLEGEMGFHIDWDGTLWRRDPIRNRQSGYVAAASHAAFAMSRSAYMSSGGYLPVAGYGGEEVHLCLKFWMLGYKCGFTQQTYACHYPGPERESGRQQTLEFGRNLALTAYVLGGRGYRDKVIQKMRLPDEVAGRVVMLGEDDRSRVLAGPLNGDLDALRKKFEAEGIEC